MSARLIHTGQVIVDVVMTVPAVPEPGGDVIATSLDETAGGGLNVIVAAIRDELPVVFTGRFGSGHYGSIVGDALAASGATIVQPEPAVHDSGFCIALVDANTERTFVTYPGAESELTISDLDAAQVNSADLVYVTGYGLAHPSNAEALTAWLPTLPEDTTVFFDPSPLIGLLDPRLVETILSRSDVVSVNLREGISMTGERDAESAARALAARVRPTAHAVVRDGADGCWVAGGGQVPELVPGFEVDAVDSNGAGDAHAGVLLAGLSRGLDVYAAARRANAAAALAVTERGPATAPLRARTDELVDAGGTSTHRRESSVHRQ
ncbi:PfkB family carbohydrate kinase [Rhodococcoides kyotonense]|uniref:Sugar or nucleoside kinase, ribokinase family n=1 Tax=Rhodococcoides kyotonense TaxID=398843 RepID=A0A239MQS6_9NOCA|nr:PfkB family carbohydrate kinase [Rhodococcus kyotonensis]SNT45096.1 Sugar or nucleoside kinase, ribokinase family [Rhodococcus kyotonensis]